MENLSLHFLLAILEKKKKKVNASHPGFALLSPQTLETLEEYMQQKHYSQLIPLWRRGCNEIELCLIYDFVSVFKKNYHQKSENFATIERAVLVLLIE